MRLILVLLLFLSVDSFCQKWKLDGRITTSDSLLNFNSLIVLLELDGKEIAGVIPDIQGYFKFEKVRSGNYRLVVSQPGYNDTISDVVKVTANSLDIDLIYDPVKDTPDKNQPKCINGHTDNIIPIVYGKPVPETVRKAHQGKIRLGGCMYSDDFPHFYCTIHQKNLYR
jgi:hypothetical protein